jgi:hypothetical protein
MKVDESKLLKLGSSIAEETVVNTSISDLSIGEDFTNMFPTDSVTSRRQKLTKMDTEIREPSIEAHNRFGKTSTDQTINMDIVEGKRSKSSNLDTTPFDQKLEKPQ